jgi:GTP-binding protein
MLFQINDGPFAGEEGRYVTSRQLRERLQRETLKNVALRVEDTERPEALQVSGRGILHLGILVEEMRREGYEFCVGKPQVIWREIDGKSHEPIEVVTVEVPEAHAGKVIELLGERRGTMVHMDKKKGVVRMEYRCPSRGLIGLRTRVLNQTRGEAALVHVPAGYEPDKGDVPGRGAGVMISSDVGEAIHYALANLKDRGVFFLPPGRRVYRGMIVGEHCKENDIPVNVCREKKLTNIRAAGSDKKIFLPPCRELSVEEALEYIEEDELVEVTPKRIRLRKILLDEGARRRSRRVAHSGGVSRKS